MQRKKPRVRHVASRFRGTASAPATSAASRPVVVGSRTGRTAKRGRKRVKSAKRGGRRTVHRSVRPTTAASERVGSASKAAVPARLSAPPVAAEVAASGSRARRKDSASLPPALAAELAETEALQWAYARARLSAAFQAQRRSAERQLTVLWQLVEAKESALASERLRMARELQLARLTEALRAQLPRASAAAAAAKPAEARLASLSDALQRSLQRLHCVGIRSSAAGGSRAGDSRHRAGAEQLADALARAAATMEEAAPAVARLSSGAAALRSSAVGLRGTVDEELAALQRCKDLLAYTVVKEGEEASLKAARLELR
eukprot:PLAT227.11.p1 GENE.PLAT227.11~~PLAT227.11.p1  ORF type:complete len:325 (-),score=105.92 PLAT227.11:1161-2114(-)